MFEYNPGGAALFAVQVALDTTHENPYHMEKAILMVQQLMDGITQSGKRVEDTREALEALHTAVMFMGYLEMADKKEFDRTGSSFLGRRREDWPGK